MEIQTKKLPLGGQGGLNIIVTRKHFLPNCTIGNLEIDFGNSSVFPVYICDTLEPHAIDWSKEKKVKGKTAIPCGKYEMAMSYSMKFHKMMPYLMNVPYFCGVMIHPGNGPRDTQGCILVGDNPKVSMDRIVPKLINSRVKMALLEKWISMATEKGEKNYVIVKEIE